VLPQPRGRHIERAAGKTDHLLSSRVRGRFTGAWPSVIASDTVKMRIAPRQAADVAVQGRESHCQWG